MKIITRPFLFVSILLLVVWILGIVFIQRPYWINDTDVELDFLFRALAIAHGSFYEHGFGIPVDIIGAVLIFLGGITLHNIDLFFPIAWGAGLVATLVSIFFLFRVFLRSLPSSLQVGAVLLFFLNPSALFYLHHWSADMFVFSIGTAALLFFWMSLQKDCKYRKLLLFLTGLFGTLALAMKLYFLVLVFSFCLSYLLMFWKEREGLSFFSVFVLGNVAGFFLGFLPFLNSLRFIVGFFLGTLAAGSGNTMQNLFLYNSALIFFHAPFWFLFVLVLLFVLFFSFFHMVQKGNVWTAQHIFLCTIIINIVFSVFAALVKANSGVFFQSSGVAIRFFLPVSLYSMFAVGIVLVRYQTLLRRRMRLLFFAVVFFFFLQAVYHDISEQRLLTESRTRFSQSIDMAVEQFAQKRGYNPTILFGDVPRPAVALFQGDQYSRGLFAEAIRLRYPKERYKNLSLPLMLSDLPGNDLVITRIGELSPFEVRVVTSEGYRGREEETLVIFERKETRRL